MKKIALISVALMALVACGPSTGTGATLPGAGAGLGTDGGGNVSVDSFLSSKQAYITFLNCVKGKAATADDKADIDKAIAAMEMVPDSTWAIVSSTYAAGAQVWAKAYGAACS